MLGLGLGLSIARPPLVVAGGGGGPSGPYAVNAVNFDGTNDNLLRVGALTGIVDGEDFLLSMWFNILGGNDATMRLFIGQNGNIAFNRNSSNKIDVFLRNVGGTQVWTWTSDLLFSTVANAGWFHLLIAAQLDVTPVGQAYVNDTPLAITESAGPIQGDIDFTQTNYALGSTVTEANRFNGDMAEAYFTNEYLDISVEANRRKFIDVNGFPVDLGAAGITPTGTAAKVLFSGDTVNWHTNKGTAGGFTETGALTDAATSPSD